MHLALLPGLMVALAGGILGANEAPTTDVAPGAPAQVQGLYSIAAQATTTTTGVTTSTSATQLAITPTIGITATTTVTASTTVTATTPVPLPTVGSQGGGLRLNPLDWTYLTSPPAPPVGPFGWAYMIIMIALFGVSAYFYFFKRLEWKRTNPVLKRAADRWGPIGLWVSGFGLLFVALRVVSLDFFNLRFWFYLWLMAAIVVIAWIYYWYRTTYPKQLAKYQKSQRARQYMPSASKKGSARQMAAPPTPSTSTSQTGPGKPQSGRRRRRR